MGGRVVWDKGNWPKCAKYGVSKAEIEYVLAAPATVIFGDPYEVEERFRAIGKTEAGRYVFVAFAVRDDQIRPISARYMHAKEIRRYVEDRR
jgi:uncharacterized DUF497 family protein